MLKKRNRFLFGISAFGIFKLTVPQASYSWVESFWNSTLPLLTIVFASRQEKNLAWTTTFWSTASYYWNMWWPAADGGDGNSSGVDDWATVRAHAAAALVQLSNHNLRFRTQALQAGALEPLTMLAEQGTQHARDKATLLLNILCTEKKLTVEGNTALYAPALYGQ